MILPAEKVGEIRFGVTGSSTPRSLQTFLATKNLVGLDNYLEFSVSTLSKDGKALEGRRVAVSSSDEDIAYVVRGEEVGTESPYVLVTNYEYGTVTITAESEGQIASLVISVVPAVRSVVVSPGSATVPVGGTVNFAATLRDATGAVITGRQVTWWMTTLQGTVYQFDSSKAVFRSAGQLTAKAAVSGRVYAIVQDTKDLEVLGWASVTVQEPVATVTVTAPASSVNLGSTVQFTATTRDASGAVIAGRAILWQSSNPGVLSINSSSGLATGVSLGNATIIATSEGKSGSLSFTVVNTPVASVAVSPTSATLQVGGTEQLSATLKDASGGVLTGRSIAWTSSNSAIASVSSSGLVTANATGTATITATSEGRSGTSSVTVQSSSSCSLTNPPVASQVLCLNTNYSIPSTSKDAQREYRVSRSANTTFTVNLSSGSGDADLYVYNPSNVIVCRSERDGSGLNESCAVSGSVGTWRIVVTAFTNISGWILRIQ